ncbi:MAG: DUF4194 domain-containing protein [Burkholderiales bacterium]|jgi:hypothetical protein|nr:DUF4194 domain-containing protein [Rhodocyclaceae bacterium]MCA3021306.1 DUF4194 domain-containing protein [Rhodocyclaceae bacterium]MCA3042375.1 DUF4194 domain-containing protein [Rhodocyclaceae bacterium]MCA3054371.1 DUF4194 domain-containing protein [Rhodocyclaceae bacterium]
MPRNWRSIAEASNGIYEVDDFKQALYQLVIQQCLYSRFQQQATAFRIISGHRRDFEEAVELLGLRMGFNDRLEFCYVIPEAVKHTALDTQDTLFLLVLRQLYHLRGSAGDLTDEGDAVVSIEELVETFRSMTGRPLEAKNQNLLKGLLKVASRCGLARLIDAPEGDPQPFAIAILPGIAEVLSENAVNRFGANLKSALVTSQPAAKAGSDRKEDAREDA